MWRHPLSLLAAKADLPNAHPLYHRGVAALLARSASPMPTPGILRAELPWITATRHTPEELGFGDLGQVRAALAASSPEAQATNHIDEGEGVVWQVAFVEAGAYVDARAELTGGVYVSAGVFMAPQAIVRMDEKSGLEPFVIEPHANLQDEVLIHANGGHVGSRCIVAHDAVIHGAWLEEDCTVYIKAIVDTGAHLGAGCFLDAAAYVGRGVRVPPRRYISPKQAVCTQEEADALPEMSAAQWAMHEEVIAHNRAHAERYGWGQSVSLGRLLEGDVEASHKPASRG